MCRAVSFNIALVIAGVFVATFAMYVHRDLSALVRQRVLAHTWAPRARWRASRRSPRIRQLNNVRAERAVSAATVVAIKRPATV